MFASAQVVKRDPTKIHARLFAMCDVISLARGELGHRSTCFFSASTLTFYCNITCNFPCMHVPPAYTFSHCIHFGMFQIGDGQHLASRSTCYSSEVAASCDETTISMRRRDLSWIIRCGRGLPTSEALVRFQVVLAALCMTSRSFANWQCQRGLQAWLGPN